ncbi:MAG: hypothetical protein ABIJ56_24465 [Pseudomonadota bacterium]
MTQFAYLDDLLQAWRTDGLGYDVLELWAVGYLTSTESVATFADGSEAACFIDDIDETIFTAWEATLDDIFVLDASGEVVYEMNCGSCSLANSECADPLDTAVRDAIP